MSDDGMNDRQHLEYLELIKNIGQKELRSKCCGAKVGWEKNHAGYDEHGNQHFYTKPYCLKCHKPTKVEERDHDEEWKNARDAYSGVREEE